jgi:hypothetical protein
MNKNQSIYKYIFVIYFLFVAVIWIFRPTNIFFPKWLGELMLVSIIPLSFIIQALLNTFFTGIIIKLLLKNKVTVDNKKIMNTLFKISLLISLPGILFYFMLPCKLLGNTTCSSDDISIKSIIIYTVIYLFLYFLIIKRKFKLMFQKEQIPYKITNTETIILIVISNIIMALSYYLILVSGVFS